MQTLPYANSIAHVEQIARSRTGALGGPLSMMFASPLALLALQLIAHATTDTARISDDRLVVEPLGFSFAIPGLWLGKPGPPKLLFCDAHPAGSVSDRILTERSRFLQLQNPVGEWKKEYAAVIDSVMPFDALVAHLGGDPWNGHCSALQMRVYVQDSSTLSPRAVSSRGAASAARYFKPVQNVRADSTGWEVTRIFWDAFYYDYGGTAQVEFWSRIVRNRRVTLVFMYTPWVEHHRAMISSILESVRY